LEVGQIKTKQNKNANTVSSYRPISLLPVLSKVFEKVLFNRIEPTLKQKNKIPPHQVGFRKQHSTAEQVHRVTNKITDDFGKKKFCSAVYLDIVKAFDKVWHKELLHKLRNILPYNLYTILQSYITDRYFYIKYDNECSDIMPVSGGVRKGSVLAPILYMIYTIFQRQLPLDQ